MTLYSNLIHAVIDRANPTRYCLHLYGSFVVQPETARDIDVVMISPDLAKVRYFSFLFNYGPRTLPCNLYCVPQSHFEEDCHMLAYGGFYAQKFAFCFELLDRSRDVPDSGEYYWRSQSHQYHIDEGVHVDPTWLIRQVHRDIFEMNPTVVRSLSKFLASPAAIERLHDFVKKSLPAKREEPGRKERDQWRTARQAAMYKFWNEYRKHKDAALGWSQTVRAKMSLSLAEVEVNLIQEYIGTTIKSKEGLNTNY